jgi:hypothetical protein
VVAHTAVASPSDRNEDGRCAHLVRFHVSVLACPLPSASAATTAAKTTRRPEIAQKSETPRRSGNELNRMRSDACDSPVERELRPGHLMRANWELSRRKINLLRDLSIRSPRPTLYIPALRNESGVSRGARWRSSCGVPTTCNRRSAPQYSESGYRLATWQRECWTRRFRPGDSRRFSKVWNFKSQEILILGFLRSND